MIRTAGAVALLLALLAPARARAQFVYGVHAARAADSFGGSTGVGASIGLGAPPFPLGFRVAAEGFIPDCDDRDGCSLWGGSAALNMRFPFPILNPYATAGLVYRRLDPGDGFDAESGTGFGGGIGLDLGTLVLRLYAEARYEVVDPDDQFVFRVGILF